MPSRTAAVALLGAVALALPVPAAASHGPAFAPVDRPGPELRVPADKLAVSLRCTAGVTNADRTPVLLLPATGVNSTENFGWNYEPALTARGIPWCTSDVPAPDAGNHNLADIQTRAEYVTYAIRTMHRRAGREISTLGHSQGGMITRWSLRFWPDTRDKVDDVIGMAPSNHGTVTAHPTCVPGCSPAIWQQRTGSRFNAALDSGQETFAGISYTTIRSDFDEIVVPESNSALNGPGRIANLRIQDRCPARPVDHLQVGTSDPVAEAYVFDALRHDGPARVSRVDPGVCLRAFMSGVDPLTYATDMAAASAALARNVALAPKTSDEPPLRCYTLAQGCRSSSAN